MESEIPPMFINHFDNTKYILEGVLCSFCGVDCEKVAHYKVEYGQKKSVFRLACNNCSTKLRKPAILNAGFIQSEFLIVVGAIPNNTRPYILRPPELKLHKLINSFDAANPEYDRFVGDGNSDYKIIDRTRLAGRPDIKGMLEVEKRKKLIEKKEAELEDPKAFFENIKKNNLLTHDGKKMIK